jgi:excisionase family DNA binding protein
LTEKLLHDKILSEIEKQVKCMPIEMNGETYYSTEEACNYLGITRDTINRMTKDGRLNKYRQGFARTVYYRKSELDNLKTIRRVEPEENNQ